MIARPDTKISLVFSIAEKFIVHELYWQGCWDQRHSAVVLYMCIKDILVPSQESKHFPHLLIDHWAMHSITV